MGGSNTGMSAQASADFEDSFCDLGTLGVLIIIPVFIVMAAQFESLTYPFILILSVPFALSGILMGLFFTGNTLSVMSLLGGIMLIYIPTMYCIFAIYIRGWSGQERALLFYTAGMARGTAT